MDRRASSISAVLLFILNNYMKPENVEGNRSIVTVPLLEDLHKSLMYFDINQIEKNR